jgi:type II secretory pathway pseudopilin PulG
MSRRSSSGTRTAPAPDGRPVGSRVRVAVNRLGASGPDHEAGFSIVMLMAGVTIMLILMAAAVPSWKYVMKDAREEELIFRATQIVDAIERFQRDPRNGGAFPVSIEVLVKGKYLRKAYEDPMVKDGKWGIIHQGEALAIPGAGRPGIPGFPGGVPGVPGGAPGVPGTGFPSPSPSASSDQGRGRRERGRTSSPNAAGQTLGPIMGVYSTSEEEGLRVVNGQTHYNDWKFVLGQPVVVGKRTLRGTFPGNLPGQPNVPGQQNQPNQIPRPQVPQ